MVSFKVRHRRSRLTFSALLTSCLLLILSSGCSDEKLSAPKLSGSAGDNAGNFTTTVFIGDSLTAGFQIGRAHV